MESIVNNDHNRLEECMSLRFLIIFLVLILGGACSDGDNPITRDEITGSGVMTTVGRTLPDFQTVIFTTVGDVNLTSGAEQVVSITVDDNISDYIITTVENGILTIGSDPNVNVKEFDLTVNLTMTDLEKLSLVGVGQFAGTNQFESGNIDISLSGVGNIIINLNTDFLNTSLSGVGNVVLTGGVDMHQCINSGIGDINAFGLESDTTVAVLSGIGSISVYVTDSLDVTLTGVGSLYYRGSPSITQNVTGYGQVINAN
jgi:hypothetical protein